MMTMGSLFDGIGGFPLAAVHNGIMPVWASEIEAFPNFIYKKRMQNMVCSFIVPWIQVKLMERMQSLI